MPAYSGFDLVLRIGDGAVPVETFLTLNGLQITQMQLEHTEVESNHLGGAGWRVLQEAGHHKVMLEAQGVFTGSAAELRLQEKSMAGEACQFELQFGNDDILQGHFIIVQFERSGGIGEIEKYRASLRSASAVTMG